jgi:hypothetical protein
MHDSLRKRGTWVVVLAGVALATAGCKTSNKVWVERQESLEVTGPVQRLAVRTHNGAVAIRGESGREAVAVKVKVRGGGRDQASAEASLAAIEVVSEPKGDGTHHLGWRWRRPRAGDWGAQVAFEITAPTHIGCDVETHNGAVTVAGVAGACALQTHNGRVVADGIGGNLSATTHNGAVRAKVTGSRVELEAHNGSVELDARDCRELGGRVVTHNGRVVIQVGPETTADIVASTDNGGVRCSAPMKTTHQTRNHIAGRLGAGGPQLTAETHNGSVTIRQ